MKNKFDVRYQFTKIARDLYNVYDSTTNTGAFLNTKDLCDDLVQKRGGVALTQDIYDMLEGADNGHTFGITESALEINKAASADGIEPWKLAEVDGKEVFVSASTGLEVEDDDKLTKKASLNKPVHTYKVAIHTGTLAKTARAHDILIGAGYTDENMYINPANPDTVVVTVQDEQGPSQVQKAMCDKMNDGYVDVTADDIECCHDFCPCGCEPFDYPDMKADEFVLIIPNNKPMFATSADSLRDYATANNFDNFKVCAADGSSVYDSAMRDAIKEIDEAMPQNQKTAEQTYKIRLKKEHEQDAPELAGKVLEWTMPQILEEINKDHSDQWTNYDASDWQEGLNEWTWYEPVEEKTADLTTDKTVFEDENTGEVFTKEQLDADPNKANRTLKTHEVNSQYINDMFKEASTIELSLAQKNLLRAAFHYCGFEKVAYLSEDSFSIKAGDAVITVDNDKASSLPFALFNDVALGEDSKEKEDLKSDSILG
jgi:hypothetical protein